MRLKILLIFLVILVGAMSLGVVSATDSENNTNQSYLSTSVQSESTEISFSTVDFSQLEGDLFPEDAAFPSEYDLRTLGRVTPVKNQGDIGSCWTFATYGSLESCLLTYEYTDFSENNLKNTLVIENPEGFDREWNEGGTFDWALAYLARWSGPINEIDDPYDPYSGYSPPDLSPVKHIQNVTIIPPRTGPLDNDNIKWAIMNYGAVGTCLHMENALPYYNSSTYSLYYDGDSNSNHAICLVGWDDNYDRNNFTIIPPGDGAFIVKNSWGTGWGDGGYFYISYYDTKLGVKGMGIIPFGGPLDIANYVFDQAESTTNYNKNYQYDPLGWVESVGYANQTAWFSNVFTSTGNDRLAAASFYVYSINSTYEVYVFLDPISGNPTSGTLVSYKTGTLMPGYRTVELDSPISISTGQIFSVVVKLTTPGYNYPIPIEYAMVDYSSNATSNPGESYMSQDGSYWDDVYWMGMMYGYYNANVCLKAFTIPEGIDVYPGDSIQDAINAASDGDTIYIHGDEGSPYTYTENITVDSLLTIQSVGDGAVTINALNINQPVITITTEGSGSIIQGFIIIGSFNSFGVYLTSANNCQITGDTISGNFIGVYVQNSNSNTVSGNTIQSNGWVGVCLDNSSSNTINGGNVITGNVEGVYIVNTANGNTIGGNSIYGNSGAGVNILNGSTGNIISENTAISNNGVIGVLIRDSDTNAVSGNTIQNNGWVGVTLDNADGNTINGSNIITGNLEGFNITNSSGNTINGNTITGNTNIGVSVINSSTGNTISSNAISNNGVIGVYLRESSTNTISGNTIQINSWSGICFDQSTSNTINGTNNISGNLEGLYLVNNSSNNIIQGNNIHENQDTGIYIYSSFGNQILSNTAISGNGVIGILLRVSDATITGNTIAGNSFAGIALDNADFNMINSNTISGSQMGIYITNNSSNNTITVNIIQENTWTGLVLENSASNTIYQNNFITNPVQAIANDPGNMFYWDGTGNYWNDWSSTERRPVAGTGGLYDEYPSTTPF